MVILIIAAAIFLIGAVLYNSLIRRKNQIEYAYGAIDAMLKKRYDLIPNLIEIVKQYMTYEQDTLSKIVALREQVNVQPGMPAEERIRTEDAITNLLGKVRIAVENYPELKANTNFIQLLGTWTEIEEQLSAARRTYNSAVTNYNNAVEMFPSNIIANMMRYTRKEVLAIPEVERQAPNAHDLFNK